MKAAFQQWNGAERKYKNWNVKGLFFFSWPQVHIAGASASWIFLGNNSISVHFYSLCQGNCKQTQPMVHTKQRKCTAGPLPWLFFQQPGVLRSGREGTRLCRGTAAPPATPDPNQAWATGGDPWQPGGIWDKPWVLPNLHSPAAQSQKWKELFQTLTLPVPEAGEGCSEVHWCLLDPC